jgi:crossover junction endodeoxyribonuclease RusA
VTTTEIRSWSLTFDGARPLTVNRVADMHRQRWATHTREQRWLWMILARDAHIPALDRVRITVTPLHRDRRSPQDPAACAPEAKAAVDGLVDARVIPDDTGRHVASVTFLPPDICGVDGLRIHIEEH